MKLLAAIGALLGACAWVVWLLYRAPEGWEDKRGFHMGRKDGGEADE